MSSPSSRPKKSTIGGWSVEDEERRSGVVYTKPWVADFILDLIGYNADSDIASQRILEPSVGDGVFIERIALRLMNVEAVHSLSLSQLKLCVSGVDISEQSVQKSRARVETVLTGHGLSGVDARDVSATWIVKDDFLSSVPGEPQYRWAVGNPPYVRLESIGTDKLKQYRARWTTMTGRADLYIGFLEGMLRHLKEDGVLGVICADRWMRNQYGRSLRNFVMENASVDLTLSLHDVDAFEKKVAAYPAISVIGKRRQGKSLVAEASELFDQAAAESLRARFRGYQGAELPEGIEASWLPEWFDTADSWPTGSPAQLTEMARLQQVLQPIENSGVEIGIGIATGADNVYICRDIAGIEPERLLPVVNGRQLSSGFLQWSGDYLLNVWSDDGALVDLEQYPGLARRLEASRMTLENRYITRKNPDLWWRTIDRVKPGLNRKSKLLLPDLKQRVHPVLDTGGHYPGHSVYYMTSDVWDLEVLGGVLLADTTNMFVDRYSVRMANGYKRSSSQYLRRIHVPPLASISEEHCNKFRVAFRERSNSKASSVMDQVLLGLDKWAARSAPV